MGNINGGMADSSNIDDSAYPLLKQQSSCLDIDINGGWNEWTVLPTATEDMGFSDRPTYRPFYGLAPQWGGAGTSFQYENVAPIFCFVRSPSGSPQTYTFEVMFDFDYLQPASQQIGGTPQTNSTALPTPCPPHHEGVSAVHQALSAIRSNHTSAAETSKSHESTFHKVLHAVSGLGHDITNPKKLGHAIAGAFGHADDFDEALKVGAEVAPFFG